MTLRPSWLLVSLVPGCHAPLPSAPPASEPSLVARRVWNLASPESDRRFGGELDCVGDLDGDGWAELAIGDESEDDFFGDFGRVWVLSGLDGHAARPLLDRSPPFVRGDLWPESASLGTSIAFVGDVDADGEGDLAIGECGGDPVNRVPPYRAWVISGATLRPIARRERSTSGFGRRVARLGDVDGDGRDDVALLSVPGRG